MFKIFRNNCCGLDVHKTWIYACIGITDANGRTEYKQARFSSFSKGLRDLAAWLANYSCFEVCLESSGKYWIPVFNILEKTCLVTLAHPKYTKPQKGNKTDVKDAKWICDLFMCDMIKPSFIPSPEIRQLRDLIRYRIKLTNMLTGEKNRAQNCLTVSNLKLDDVFSDVFGKSSRSITNHMLDHPGETFDVAPFVDARCQTPLDEIQAAVDGAISSEQAVKLRQCLAHIDELEAHRKEIEREILMIAEPFSAVLELLYTLPGLDKNPMTAIAILSEIGPDMSVFPSSKHLVSWAGCCPRNDQSNQKVKSRRISRAGCYLKPLLVQVANSLIKSKKHPEFKERYRRIKSHRGHKKAIIAVCKMLLTAIWNMLSKLEPYNPDGFLEHRPVNEKRVLTKSQALELLRLRGYTITND
ncbi:IS110 family transposase [[Clostridium] symbiosum]|uniref:Transposase n=1 Tax=Hungatella hathewayi TaxID=154046 RepID=A0A174BVY6_9FIRM|nr:MULTISPECIES: IS110 family transposase [Clostridia]MCQ4835034.1 IS110 family transposase [[Clostridium] symbiosum]MDB2010997.1 IS110 family transposase [[Clostridium] symbiosum]MDB2026468.1 IS110 family transposase [[Clostridium] symbiosum]CUO03805.1 transposase [Hungatella hathewayi]